MVGCRRLHRDVSLLHLGLCLLLRHPGECVRAEALAAGLARLEGDLHRRLGAVVLECVLLQLVAPRAAVLALAALERLVVQVDALVSHQVALLDERPATHAADVTADAHVRAHVARQLAPLRRHVLAVRVLAVENITCCTQSKICQTIISGSLSISTGHHESKYLKRIATKMTTYMSVNILFMAPSLHM